MKVRDVAAHGAHRLALPTRHALDVWETSAQVDVVIDDEPPIDRNSVLFGFLYWLLRERGALSFLDHGLKVGTEAAQETGDDEEADAEDTDGAQDHADEEASRV